MASHFGLVQGEREAMGTRCVFLFVGVDFR